MLALVLGIVVFLGVHTLTTLRERRKALIASYGEGRYKAAYSIASAIGLILIVWGFASYRASGYIPVWSPPRGMAHLSLLLMLFAFIALVAAYAPAGKIKSTLKHPMLVAIKIWALAHLLANGDLGSMILFGSFLGWAVYDRIAVKKRAEPVPPPAPFGMGDWIALGGGAAAWLIMFMLHRTIIGVSVLSG